MNHCENITHILLLLLKFVWFVFKGKLNMLLVSQVIGDPRLCTYMCIKYTQIHRGNGTDDISTHYIYTYRDRSKLSKLDNGN